MAYAPSKFRVNVHCLAVTTSCDHCYGVRFIRNGRLRNSEKMQTGSPTSAIIAALLRELVSINAANILYWKKPEQDQTREERAEYQRRQDRVKGIRDKLDQLRSIRAAQPDCEKQ